MTLETIVSSTKKSNDQLVELMKEHIPEQIKLNGKINIFYDNKYEEADPSSILISGITADVVSRDIVNQSAYIETATSIKAMQSNIQSLFIAQSIITKDMEQFTECLVQSKNDINLMFINQHQIMVALRFPTPMLSPHATDVAAVSPESSDSSSS